MKNAQISTNFILLLNLLLLLNISSSYIIFPFSLIKENNHANINPDMFSYNYQNFFGDNYEQLIYINMTLGYPPHEIKASLTYEDSDFKIRNISECINYNIYSNQQININAYSNINLINKINCKNINFSLYNSYTRNEDNNDLICGSIGFSLIKYHKEKKYNILNNLYSKKYINNSNWILKYTSKEKGFLILGTNDLKEIFPNYNENNLYTTRAIIEGVSFYWTFNIQKVISISTNSTNNKNETFVINSNIVNAQINNDFNLIQGNYKYNGFIENNFFKKYLDKKICMKTIWYKSKYSEYFVYECMKKYFDKNDLENFPLLILLSFDANVKLEFDYKDLFTETKHKYFFNIIFSVYNTDNWVLGKIFLQKYLILINSQENLIKIYLDNNKEIIDDNNTNNNITVNNTNNIGIKIDEEKKKKINWKIILIILLFIPFGLLCFYFGRKIRRERRKKANELIDEYDYDSKKDYNKDANKKENKNENDVVNYHNL